MEVTRALRVETLRARIDRSEYHVDVDKVAEAVLGRPTARLWILPASVRTTEPKVGNGSGSTRNGYRSCS